MKTLSHLALAAALFAAGCATPASSDAETPMNPHPTRANLDHGFNRPPQAATLHAMARVMAAQGRDAECELVLRELIDTYPDFLAGYNELAELYLRNDRFDQAAGALCGGLERAPEDLVLLNNLGATHLLRRDYQAAVETLTPATELAPKDARSQTNLAVALGMLARDEEALACFARVLPAWEAHYNLGVVAEARGDAQAAEVQYAIAEDLKDRARKGKSAPAETEVLALEQ